MYNKENASSERNRLLFFSYNILWLLSPTRDLGEAGELTRMIRSDKSD